MVPDPLVPIAPIAGFGLVVALVSILNERRPVDVGGLFPLQGRNDWPQGVQEPDAPRFVLDRPDRRQPFAAEIDEVQAPAGALPRPERVLPRVHRFVPDRRP
jgi:hypothetical protein